MHKDNGAKNVEIAKVVFKEELEHIKSDAIRGFTLACFKDLTPDYFWDFTASSTSNYHPKVSNKKHGIVVHTKLAVWWGRELADNFNVQDTDIIISALLLHDLQKFGMTLDRDNKPTLAGGCGTHGPLLAIQIENVYKNINFNADVSFNINTLLVCVSLHMGRFTNNSLVDHWENMIKPDDKIILNIVQLADYCSSRKVDAKIEELDNFKFKE